MPNIRMTRAQNSEFLRSERSKFRILNTPTFIMQKGQNAEFSDSVEPSDFHNAEG